MALLGDVKADIATASRVGNCTVFDVGGNKYRLVTRILYQSQKVFILRVMTHKQYDDKRWQEECGCFQPPPALPVEPKSGGSARRGKRKRG